MVGDAAHEAANGFGRIGKAAQIFPDARGDHLAGAGNSLGSQFLLPFRKVIVERALRRTALGHDLVEAGSVIALFFQQVTGRFDKLLSR